MTTALIHLLLAFGIVVVVPLALPLAGARRWVLAARLVGPLAAISFLVRPGLLAGALALPWLFVCIAIALDRARRVRGFGRREIVETLPLAYLVGGAGWLALARYGRITFGFGPRIVELAAMHFHYAGFVASVWMLQIAGLVRSWPARAALVAVLLATPLTAAGITFAPVFGAAGAGCFLAGAVAGSVIVLKDVVPRSSPPGSAFLAASAWAVAGTIALAVLYSVGQWLGTPGPSLATMAWTHGVLNAFVFGLCGVSGWRMVGSPPEKRA